MAGRQPCCTPPTPVGRSTRAWVMKPLPRIPRSSKSVSLEGTEMRNGRVAGSLAGLAMVALGLVASPDAQRRGGAPPQGGPPGGRGGRGASAVERITVRGQALEGND